MAKGKAKRKTMARYGVDVMAPTPERAQHDPVERLGRQIVDSEGGIGNPFRTIDVLGVMFKRGSITFEMDKAGRQFRDDFDLGALHGIRAGSMFRLGGSQQGDAIAIHQQCARDRIAAALAVAGGRTSPCGSCMWHILGEGKHIDEWATMEGWRGRPLRRETASGILIGALGMLVVHYGLDEQVRSK